MPQTSSFSMFLWRRSANSSGNSRQLKQSFGRAPFQARRQFGNRRAETLGILLGRRDGQAKHLGAVDQPPHIPYNPRSRANRCNQFFLHVDHQAGPNRTGTSTPDYGKSGRIAHNRKHRAFARRPVGGRRTAFPGRRQVDGHGSNQGNSPAAEFCRERAPSRSFGPGTPRRAFPTEPAGLLP